MKNIYVYPAIFTFDNNGVAVEFPDLPGCFSCADSQEEAVINAKEALALHLWSLEDDEEPIPSPSQAHSLSVGEGEVIVFVDAWMPAVRERLNNKAVNKTVTIPRWLDVLAKREGISCSSVLQEGLKERLNQRETVHHS